MFYPTINKEHILLQIWEDSFIDSPNRMITHIIPIYCHNLPFSSRFSLKSSPVGYGRIHNQ